MKRIICLLLAVLMLFALVGCGSDIPVESHEEETAMFVVVENSTHHGYSYTVMYHKDTRVMYIVSNFNEFTVMVDPDGDPLLYR